MKLFEKLRWLPTESPTPGTADVSANSCVPPTFGGATPGTRSATSRKLRPLRGIVPISAWKTVLAIWLRPASSTVAWAATSTVASTVLSDRDMGSSYAEPSVSVRRRAASAKPSSCTTISYDPTLR